MSAPEKPPFPTAVDPAARVALDALSVLPPVLLYRVLHGAAQHAGAGKNLLLALLSAESRAIQERDLEAALGKLGLPDGVTVKRRLDGQYEIAIKGCFARTGDAGEVRKIADAMSALAVVAPFRKAPGDVEIEAAPKPEKRECPTCQGGALHDLNGKAPCSNCKGKGWVMR